MEPKDEDLKLTVEREGDRTVVTCEGEVDIYTCARLKEVGSRLI